MRLGLGIGVGRRHPGPAGVPLTVQPSNGWTGNDVYRGDVDVLVAAFVVTGGVPPYTVSPSGDPGNLGLWVELVADNPPEYALNASPNSGGAGSESPGVTVDDSAGGYVSSSGAMNIYVPPNVVPTTGSWDTSVGVGSSTAPSFNATDGKPPLTTDVVSSDPGVVSVTIDQPDGGGDFKVYLSGVSDGIVTVTVTVTDANGRQVQTAANVTSNA